MGVTAIKINSYKCIKNMELAITDLNLLIGANGSGKSNVISAIQYFYDNLTSVKSSLEVFDQTNRFSNEITIAVEYDLSDFAKIARSQIKQIEMTDNYEGKYYPYYQKILSMCSGANDNRFLAVFRQIKGQQPTWNIGYEERFIIKSLFPFYYIDTRNTNALDWTAIWNSMGDLAKISNQERVNFAGKYKELIDDTLHQKLESVEAIMSKSDVDIQKISQRDFAKLLLQLYQGGQTFISKGMELSYFSTGTNSVKYLITLLNTVYAVSRLKLKDPLLIIDEPELNLHHSYIDKLSETVVENAEHYRILIATHSPRLLKNVLMSETSHFIYSLKMQDKYTKVRKMKLFGRDERYRNVITDAHANAYFSKAMLLVEGETEVEIFTNRYIRWLFPCMKDVDVFVALSDNVERDIILPSRVGIDVNYLMVIDMDKAVRYDKTKRRFSKSEYLKMFNGRKGEFAYRSQISKLRQNTYSTERRLNAMMAKCNFWQSKPVYACNDFNYLDFVGTLKQYLLQFRTFVNQTTAEGLLINRRTAPLVFEYAGLNCRNKKVFDRFRSVYENYSGNQAVNILRLLFDGKTDLLCDVSQTELSENEKDAILSNKFKKNKSHWISEFIEYYFRSVFGELGLPSDDFDFSTFKKHLSDNEVKKTVLKRFCSDFSEFYSIIRLVDKMIL